MIRGVIFDMDGLMTDTERLFQELWCQVMRQRGYPEFREVVAYCIGLNHRAIDEYVRQNIGPEFDYISALREVGRLSEEHMAQHGIPVKPGLYTLLSYLDAEGISYVVATSSLREKAEQRLSGIGVLSRLHGLVTGDMVKVGKPEPEIFEKAAELLGLPPEDCIVLEDSPHGILAAHRAGCRPVMIPDLKEPDPETARLLYAKLDGLESVIDLLKQT